MKEDLKKKSVKKAILFELAALFGLVVAISISMVKFESTCEDVRKSVLRLHVIANSDSDEDQALKLKVRDALLETGSEIFSGTLTAESAKTVAEREIDFLEETAENVLKENGSDDEVRVEICQSRFPTRTYENVTLPAGEYEAVKVIIGEGEGHNWWCVMFPPMCLPAAEKERDLDDVLTADGIKLVSSDPKYEVRFKFIEWYERIKEKIG